MTLLTLREAWSRGIKMKVEKTEDLGKTLYTLELCGASCLEDLAKFFIFLGYSLPGKTHRNACVKPEAAEVFPVC